jgi:hypothetical protein
LSYSKEDPEKAFSPSTNKPGKEKEKGLETQLLDSKLILFLIAFIKSVCLSFLHGINQQIW